MNDDYFLGKHSFIVGENKEIDAFGGLLHSIVIAVAACSNVDFKSINRIASHVEHFDNGWALHVLKVNAHLSVVGVGQDVDLGLSHAILINVEERGLEVDSTLLSFTVIAYGGG